MSGLLPDDSLMFRGLWWASGKRVEGVVILGWREWSYRTKVVGYKDLRDLRNLIGE